MASERRRGDELENTLRKHWVITILCDGKWGFLIKMMENINGFCEVKSSNEYKQSGL